VGKAGHKKKTRRAERAKERRVQRLAQEATLVPEPAGEAAESEEIQSGIVAEVRKDAHCTVLSGDRLLPARSSMPVVVGDRVKFRGQGEGFVIRELLPRKTRLVRMRGDASRHSDHGVEEHVLAANVDVAVVVASTTAPPFHPRLLDRYLIMCQYGGIAPVICMNKMDKVESPPDLSVYSGMGIPIVYVSAFTGQGMEELRGHLRHRCSVLTGHSGVGKSTIFNALLDKDVQRIGDLTQSSRGRHTTTGSLLYKLGEDAYLIDTPGIRSLGLRGDKRTLRFYFPDFAQAASGCKYRDCSHTHEPGCAVKEAVQAGEISHQRYDSYLRLMNE